MTDETKALLTELRHGGAKFSRGEAANLIESQAARIEELQSTPQAVLITEQSNETKELREHIKRLRLENIELRATAEVVERAGHALERKDALWKEPSGFGTRLDNGSKIVETYHDTLLEALEALAKD